MILEENWAVHPDRVRAFFAEQPDVTPQLDGFSFGDCTITLTVLEGSVGPWAMVRTGLRFSGPDDQVQAIHQRFFLRFLSAGG